MKTARELFEEKVFGSFDEETAKKICDMFNESIRESESAQRPKLCPRCGGTMDVMVKRRSDGISYYLECEACETSYGKEKYYPRISTLFKDWNNS